MQNPEQVAAKKAAAAALLDVHPDRIWICGTRGEVYIDDRRKPVRKKEFAIIVFKAMLMEWLGWADNEGATRDFCTYYPRTARPILERNDLIGVASLAVHLRDEHGA